MNEDDAILDQEEDIDEDEEDVDAELRDAGMHPVDGIEEEGLV